MKNKSISICSATVIISIFIFIGIAVLAPQEASTQTSADKLNTVQSLPKAQKQESGVRVNSKAADKIKVLTLDKTPDLEPVNPDNDITNCCLNPAYQMVFYVKNNGFGPSTPCVTSVTFRVSHALVTIDIPTPAIEAGQTVGLTPVNHPGGCFGPDCMYTITVDSKNQVKEKNEGNNSIPGWCIG